MGFYKYNKLNKKLILGFFMGLFIGTICLGSLFQIKNDFKPDFVNIELNHDRINALHDLYDYLGQYSFTYDDSGTKPTGWTIIEDPSTHCRIIDEMEGHHKVVEFYDAGSGAEMYKDYSTQTSGTVELWYYGHQSGSNNAGILNLGDGTNHGAELNFRIASQELHYDFDSSSYYICDLSNDEWHHIRIVFSCVTHTYDVYLNGNLEGDDLPFWDNINIDQIYFKTGSTASGGYYFYIDAIDYSWAPGYYLNRNMGYNIDEHSHLLLIVLLIIGIIGAIGISIGVYTKYRQQPRQTRNVEHPQPVRSRETSTISQSEESYIIRPPHLQSVESAPAFLSCSKCGFKHETDQLFCTQCGAELE